MPKTKVKDRPVGTIFKWYNKKLEVVEDDIQLELGCEKCVFQKPDNRYNCFNTSCNDIERKDRKFIHYKLLELCQK